MDNRSVWTYQLTGVVKGGVIVPDTPLAEGTHVEITVPNAPREILDRVRAEASSRDSRDSVPSSEAQSITSDATAFLRYYAAEPVFTQIAAWVKECFPDHTRLDVSLVEDSDAPGKVRVLCLVSLSADTPRQQKFDAERRFFKEFPVVVRLSLRHCSRSTSSSRSGHES